MKIPNLSKYTRFYRYGGKDIMVQVGDPYDDPYTQYYKYSVNGLASYDYRSTYSYKPHNYEDWCVCDNVPDHIPPEQHFKWYFDFWKKNK